MLDEVAAEKAERFNEQMRRLGFIVEGTGQTIAGTVIDVILPTLDLWETAMDETVETMQGRARDLGDGLPDAIQPGLDTTLALIVSWGQAALGTVSNVISGIANLNPATLLTNAAIDAYVGARVGAGGRQGGPLDLRAGSLTSIPSGGIPTSQNELRRRFQNAYFGGRGIATQLNREGLSGLGDLGDGVPVPEQQRPGLVTLTPEQRSRNRQEALRAEIEQENDPRRLDALNRELIREQSRLSHIEGGGDPTLFGIGRGGSTTDTERSRERIQQLETELARGGGGQRGEEIQRALSEERERLQYLQSGGTPGLFGLGRGATTESNVDRSRTRIEELRSEIERGGGSSRVAELESRLQEELSRLSYLEEGRPEGLFGLGSSEAGGRGGASRSRSIATRVREQINNITLNFHITGVINEDSIVETVQTAFNNNEVSIVRSITAAT